MREKSSWGRKGKRKKEKEKKDGMVVDGVGNGGGMGGKRRSGWGRWGM